MPSGPPLPHIDAVAPADALSYCGARLRERGLRQGKHQGEWHAMVNGMRESCSKYVNGTTATRKVHKVIVVHSECLTTRR